MALYNEQNPKTNRKVDSDYSQDQNENSSSASQSTQSNSGSKGTLGLIITAILLALGAYYLFAHNGTSTIQTQPVTQNDSNSSAPAANTKDSATSPATETPTTIKPDATKPAQ